MARKHKKNQPGPSATKNAPQSGGVFPQSLAFSFSTLGGLSLFLAFAAAILYMPITSHPFVNYDDAEYIIENPNIQNGLTAATFKWAATSLYSANWHPLTWLVHAADFQIYGLDAGGHHSTSLVFHAANVVLLFLLLAFATRAVGRSFFVAALFALHPLNVESVAWAAELKNLLSTFFFLLALGAYGSYARKPSVGRYLPVFLLFLFGLAAKPMVITLPFVLLLLDYWPLSRFQKLAQTSDTPGAKKQSWPLLLEEKLPLLALIPASAWVTILAQKASKADTMVHPSLAPRLANALVSYATYIREALVPIHLAPFYPFPIGGIPVWKVLSSVTFLLAISVLALRFARAHGYLLVGWLWFLGTLVPVLGLFQVGAQAHADRYTYIPMMGLLVMLVWGYSEFCRATKISRTLQAVAPSLALALLCFLTVRQISYWNSSYDLWSHTLAVTSDNATAEHNISIALIRSGRIDQVYPHLLRAVELDPSDSVSRINLGNVYSSQGRCPEALREFRKVIENSADPKLLLPAFVNSGSCYRKLGEFANAETAYREALRIAPGNPAALQGLEAVQQARVAASSN